MLIVALYSEFPLCASICKQAIMCTLHHWRNIKVILECVYQCILPNCVGFFSLIFFSFWHWIKFKNFPVCLLDFVLSTGSSQLHPHSACLEMMFAGKVNVNSSNAWDFINQSPRIIWLKK